MLVERDKLFVEFDWTSEVDDIAVARGESDGVFPEYFAECVLFMVVLLLCCVLVWLVVAVRRTTG